MVAVSDKNTREYTTVSIELSEKIAEDAEKYGRGTKSKQINYILNLYYKYKDEIEKLNK